MIIIPEDDAAPEQGSSNDLSQKPAVVYEAATSNSNTR